LQWLAETHCDGRLSLGYRPSFLHHSYAMGVLCAIAVGLHLPAEGANVINGRKVIYATA